MYSSGNFPSTTHNNNFTYRVSSLDRHSIEDLGISVGVHGEEREEGQLGYGGEASQGVINRLTVNLKCALTALIKQLEHSVQ